MKITLKAWENDVSKTDVDVSFELENISDDIVTMSVNGKEISLIREELMRLPGMIYKNTDTGTTSES